MGYRSVDKATFKKTLAQGRSVALVPGGIAGMGRGPSGGSGGQGGDGSVLWGAGAIGQGSHSVRIVAKNLYVSPSPYPPILLIFNKLDLSISSYPLIQSSLKSLFVFATLSSYLGILAYATFTV